MSKQDKLVVNAIRVLSAEAVQQANSGHPGMPMGSAAMAYALWGKQMKFDPKCPKWDDRDRFVLSSGHGSMLLYSLLHLFGFGLTIEDLKQFRQFGSLTPGHPEYGHTVGVETTTGPLGQGITNAVGMALAESYLAAHFNREGFNIVDHNTYAIMGDGCLMEGISHEAASLAGTLKLNKLIALYDDNEISIEGNTAIACSRTPKCRLEPVRSSAEKSPRPFMLDLLEGARSAEPPIRFGMRLARRFSTSPEEARVAEGPSNFQ